MGTYINSRKTVLDSWKKCHHDNTKSQELSGAISVFYDSLSRGTNPPPHRYWGKLYNATNEEDPLQLLSISTGEVVPKSLQKANKSLRRWAVKNLPTSACKKRRFISALVPFDYQLIALNGLQSTVSDTTADFVRELTKEEKFMLQCNDKALFIQVATRPIVMGTFRFNLTVNTKPAHTFDSQRSVDYIIFLYYC
jgi:hypothetical protein